MDSDLIVNSPKAPRRTNYGPNHNGHRGASPYSLNWKEEGNGTQALAIFPQNSLGKYITMQG
jgi:hypothetical protein